MAGGDAEETLAELRTLVAGVGNPRYLGEDVRARIKECIEVVVNVHDACSSYAVHEAVCGGLLVMREYEQCRKVAVVFCERWGGTGKPWLVRGQALRGLGRPLDSVSMLDKALALPMSNADRSLATYIRSELSLNLGNTLDALEGFLSVERQEGPSYRLLQYYLGNCFFTLNRYEAALQRYRKALEVHPSHQGILFNMGGVYGKLGKRRQALDTFIELLRVNPSSSRALIYAAGLYQIDGRNLEALNCFSRAFKLNPKLATKDNIRRYEMAFAKYTKLPSPRSIKG